ASTVTGPPTAASGTVKETVCVAVRYGAIAASRYPYTGRTVAARRRSSPVRMRSVVPSPGIGSPERLTTLSSRLAAREDPSPLTVTLPTRTLPFHCPTGVTDCLAGAPCCGACGAGEVAALPGRA